MAIPLTDNGKGGEKSPKSIKHPDHFLMKSKLKGLDGHLGRFQAKILGRGNRVRSPGLGHCRCHGLCHSEIREMG